MAIDAKLPITEVTFNDIPVPIQIIVPQDQRDEYGAFFDKTASVFTDPQRLMRTIPQYINSSAAKLTTLVLPATVTIGDNAFINAKSLMTVTAPEVVTIRQQAFFGCAGLNSILTFPKVSVVSDYAFAGCSNLRGVDFPTVTSLRSGVFSNCAKLESVSFPECVYVGTSAFYGCSTLSYANFPKLSATAIQMFMNDSNLTTVSLPNCSYVAGSCFLGCTKLSSVYLPSCRTLASSAFYNCYALSEIDFPILSSIYNSAFQNCSGLTSITFGSSSVQIAPWTFKSCVGLKSIEISGLVAAVQGAFESCSNLSFVKFGSNCTTIGPSAFSSCSSLEKLILGRSSCNLQNVNAFAGTPLSDSTYLGRYGSIYVPDDYVDYYKTSTNWSTYADRIVGVSKLNAPNIPNGTYDSKDDSYYLKSFTVTDGVITAQTHGSSLDDWGDEPPTAALSGDTVTITYADWSEWGSGTELPTTELIYDSSTNSFVGQVYKRANRATLVDDATFALV